MSINSAMLAGVSGLTANSSALAAISDNIANVNTTAYKRNEADFQTLVTAQATGASYSAGGVLSTSRQFVSQQGILQRTSSATDLGISGSGFFVTTQKAEGLTATDARLFTRAGSFSVDNQGYLKNSAGLYLQGWLVDAQGDIATDPSDLSRLSSINVASIGGTADPTTRVALSANLKSSQTVSADATITPPASAPAYDPATNSMSMYDPTAATPVGVKPDFEMQIPISDSKGGKRTLAIDFLKSSVPNQWYAEIRAVPASDINDGTGLTNGQVATGIVAFTPSGRLDTTNTTLFADPTNPVINIGSSASTPGAGQASWSAGLGVAGQSLAIDMNSGAGGLTQFDSQSVAEQVTTNGTAFGNLTNISIDDNGFVTAVFDNGVTRKIAQVAMATFANPDGLKAVSGNAYKVTDQSGTYNLKSPGSGGAGTISPDTLEASTVDLSSEFTGLITTQRAYAASSKIITTADQMMQELLNIKQ